MRKKVNLLCLVALSLTILGASKPVKGKLAGCNHIHDETRILEEGVVASVFEDHGFGRIKSPCCANPFDFYIRSGQRGVFKQGDKVSFDRKTIMTTRTRVGQVQENGDAVNRIAINVKKI